MQLTWKSKKFKWTKEQQLAFEKSKSAVAEAITLTYPNVSKPLILYADASDHAMGRALAQDNKTIFYFSKNLTPTQQNNTVTDSLWGTQTQPQHYFWLWNYFQNWL